MGREGSPDGGCELLSESLLRLRLRAGSRERNAAQRLGVEQAGC